ncbi:MAG: LSM domain-containing protein [Candidatus Caldarchaeales archaeon]
METGKKPLLLITKYLNRSIKVTLKNDLIYEGTVVDCDSYMNLVIEKAVEYQDNSKRAIYPRILIRGNNIMYIQLIPGESE